MKILKKISRNVLSVVLLYILTACTNESLVEEHNEVASYLEKGVYTFFYHGKSYSSEYVVLQDSSCLFKNKEVAMSILKSKLLELEIKKQEEELKAIKGTQMDINFGSQIRSYIFCPYTLVKDHRTGYEMTNVNQVMDGDIEGFMLAYLKLMAGNENE